MTLSKDVFMFASFFGELILISSQKWKYNYFLKLFFFLFNIKIL